MIAGNPKAGRRLAGAAIAALVVMFIVTLIVAVRKKQAPAQGPPLVHPSILVIHSSFQGGGAAALTAGVMRNLP